MSERQYHKYTIEDSTETQAKLILDGLLRNCIMEFHLYDGDTITGTCSPVVAGVKPKFNTAEEFYIYDLDENDWVGIRFDAVESMEHVDRAR